MQKYEQMMVSYHHLLIFLHTKKILCDVIILGSISLWVRWHWLRLSIKSPRPPWQLFKATAAFTFTFLKATAHFTFTFFEGHHSLTLTFFTVRLVLGLRLTSNDVSMGHISRFSQSLMICLWVTSSNLSSHAFAFFAHPTPGSAVLWYSASISSWWSPTSWSS